MTRNNFNIVRSVGLIFFGFGIFLVGSTLPEIMDRIAETYGNGESIWDDYLAVYTILGISFAVTGLAGLLKLKWFSKIGSIILVLSIIGFLLFFFEEMLRTFRRGDTYVIVGVLIMAFTTIISFILLLNNHYFLEALSNEDDFEEKDDRILDA